VATFEKAVTKVSAVMQLSLTGLGILALAETGEPYTHVRVRTVPIVGLSLHGEAGPIGSGMAVAAWLAAALSPGRVDRWSSGVT